MQQLPTGGILLDAFPFDSNPNNITTVNGYLRGDRSVDAWTMRSAFRQFFSSGVFGTPANAFQLGKGESGLSVTVQPGMCVIEGAMGGVESRNGAITLQLDSGPAAGNVCYGVFLRYDDNADTRGIALVSRKGEAGASPQPPAPDTSSANVHELRLGYVTVPNGASGLENATVTNEKGLDVCPYAAPFEKIDLSDVVSDMRASGAEALQKLLDYFETYRDVIDAALSGEAATYLQQQITALQEQFADFDIDLANEVDNATIEYTGTDNPVDPKKLRVKAGGIEKDNLSKWLRIEIGIEDTESWTYDDFKEALQEAQGDADKQNDLMVYLDDTIVTSWTAAQITEFASLLLDSVQPKFVGYITEEKLKSMSASEVYTLSEELSQSARDSMADKIDMLSYGWGDMHLIHQAIGDKKASAYVGKSRNVSVSGRNYPTMLIGVAHDTATDSNGSTLTFQFKNTLDVDGYKKIEDATTASAGYPATVMRLNYFDKVIDLFPQALKNAIRAVTKPCQYFNDSNTVAKKTTFTGKVWPISISELVDTTSSEKRVGAVRMNMFNAANGDGELYEYYAQHVWTTGNMFPFPTGSETPFTVFRSGANNDRNSYCLAIMVNSTSGSASISSYVPGQAAGICPCFCI